MNEYRDIYKSVFRFAHTMTEILSSEGYQFSVHNMEAFANPQEWPAEDFIGVDEMRVEFTDPHKIYVYTLFVISTRDDRNLMRMNEVTNLMVNMLIPTRRIPIYSGETGEVRGRLIIRDGTRVDRPVQTDSQPARPIMVSMVSDQLSSA